MRRTTFAITAAFTIVAAAALAPNTAQAMTLTTPAAIQAAVDDTNLAQDVAYVCRRAWRCGPYGCGFRRSCFWTGGPRYHRRHHRRW